MSKDSDAELVRQFTRESSDPLHLPNEPTLMTKDEIFFLFKMMLDEMMELGATVDEAHEIKYAMIKMIAESKDIPQITGVPVEVLIGEQADALVDCYYYSLNAAAKKGVNLSKVFNVVHAANMAKRDPTTGKFLKRQDGKIIKPEGWVAPNITAEIKKQIEERAFNN